MAGLKQLRLLFINKRGVNKNQLFNRHISHSELEGPLTIRKFHDEKFRSSLLTRTHFPKIRHFAKYNFLLSAENCLPKNRSISSASETNSAFKAPSRIQGDLRLKKASGGENHDSDKDPKSVAYWYLATCALVFATIAVGGLTRLTESGLSIVEWNLIKGVKAPSSEEEWQSEFEKYKQYPEYNM